MPPITKEAISSIDDLKSYVYWTLCNDNQLLFGDHPTSEDILRRGSDICGMFFYLQGPRAVRLSAVWDRHGNRVLFYNSNGRRYREVELGNGEIVVEDEVQAKKELCTNSSPKDIAIRKAAAESLTSDGQPL
jgi:hypothetical protein